MSLGTAIDYYRKHTIEETATDMGIPPQYMEDVCKGLREPGLDFVVKAADILGVTVYDLYTRA